ncbi:calcium-binding protein [Methyloradius palustris]|uniref:Uncharacterized protein n=1 Tax=Methyloradius palustris TaxID=2778876 RepID=A0A8D5GC69_9PROT|nr:calcium-binding protein [Methyloradius palustris]BCM25591.1 hypothetical protein ZMTM_18500 [Methyloradius palustris]
MVSVLEYMKFSLNVYAASDVNLIGVPLGWDRFSWQPDKASGFSAGAFYNSQTNEMVISYTGTNDKLDMLNWAIGIAVPSTQLFDAIDYYFTQKAVHPNATITFTGHSLGGGLASLMSVYFNKQATVFDEAPFQMAAQDNAITNLVNNYMQSKGYTDSNFSNYVLQSQTIQSTQTLIASREQNITHYYLQGEILNYPRFPGDTLVGPEYVIPTGNTNAAPVELHSMGLMTAIQYSSAFHNAVNKLPDLVSLLADDKNLYAAKPETSKPDLLRRLLSHEFGVAGSVTADNMLTRFASDMTKLAKDGGLTMKDPNGPWASGEANVSKMLMAFAMQMYYENPNATNSTKELFSELTGGIKFDIADVASSLSDAKGYNLYFKQYLNHQSQAFGAQANKLINTNLPNMQDWYVQAGTGGMVASGNQSRASFMLGGDAGDNLTGGDKADLLIGNAGNDTLNGGSGNDTLFGGEGDDQLQGGAGEDLYQFSYRQGNDTILDSDTKGQVKIQDIVLKGGKNQSHGALTWYNDPNTKAFTYSANSDPNAGPVTLTITNLVGGTITVNNFKNGDLGITLKDTDPLDKPKNSLPKALENGQVTYAQAERTTSPLILDLDGDGVETTTLDNGVYFDHDGNSFAQKTAWASADDGMLVRDIDGNGIIDNGSELFGNNTALSTGTNAANGFAALADLDSNQDGKIDSTDTAFSTLQIWQDTNQDGVSQISELKTLTQANVQSINLGYTSTAYTISNPGIGQSNIGYQLDANGNEQRELGTYTTTTNQTRSINDIWFKQNTMNTVSTTSVAVSAEIAAMPDLDGWGNLTSLQQAMARDTTGQLKTLVTQYGIQTDPAARDATLNSILYYWAGVQDVDPASRSASMIYGNAIGDARKLEFLETLYGESYLGTWCWGVRDPNPHGPAAAILLKNYEQVKAYFGAELTLRGQLGDLLNKVQFTNDSSGNPVNFNVDTLITTLESAYATDSAGALSRLNALISNLRILGVDGGTGILNELASKANPIGTPIRQALVASLSTTINDINSSSKLNGIFGSSNYINGYGGNDTIQGADQADILLGGDGNDSIIGADGDDILNGGTGNDFLSGGNGADTYQFGVGFGQDTIVNFDNDTFGSHVDSIVFDSSITPANISVRRDNSELIITVNGTSDSITVSGYFTDDGTSPYAVESIKFSDGTTWTAATVNAMVMVVTTGDDKIFGYVGNDNLNGLAGNDVITSYAGNDTLDGGAGNDTLYGGDGGDTYIFNRGSGIDVIQNYELNPSGTALDILKFGTDILPTDIALSRTGDDLIVKIKNTTDQVTIQKYFYKDGLATEGYALDQIQFANGTIWDIPTIKTKLITPTAGDDTIIGYATDDTIYGDDGTDSMYGMAGNDTMIGGAGTDRMDGGDGDDTYQINLGDSPRYLGQAYEGIIDTNTGNNKIVFGAGITLDSIHLSLYSYNGSKDIILSYSPTDSIFIENGVSSTIKTYAFADGTSISQQALMAAKLGASTIYAQDTADVIYGGQYNDVIWGGGGNDFLSGQSDVDVLIGGRGDDTLEGGSGDDQLVGDDYSDYASYVPVGNETYIYKRGDGFDYINDLKGNNRILFGSGILTTDVTLFRMGDDLYVVVDASNNQMRWANYFNATTANSHNDRIEFADGTVWNKSYISTNTVYGSADSFVGTSGDDTFIVDNINDVITEAANQGIDNVHTSVSYTLPSNIENITATGYLNITLTGNALSNNIVGNASNNTLNGGVGDTLNGGAGNDVLNGGSLIHGGVGNDTIYASANAIAYGDDGDDYLDGGPGSTLMGGLGNDTYVQDSNSQSIVVEQANEGIDTIVTNKQYYTLQDGIENLTLSGSYMTLASATGNALDNVILGWSDDLVSSSRFINGGLGADTMISRSSGGMIFYVDNIGDKTISGGGVDKVMSSINWTLTADIDNLELLSDTYSVNHNSISDPLNGTGNELDNFIKGNKASNIIYGLAGNDLLMGNSGTDTLYGGDGNDTLYGGSNIDTEYDGYLDLLVGGKGDDVYYLHDGLNQNTSGTYVIDNVVELDNEGIDTVHVSRSYVMGNNIENAVIDTQYYYPPFSVTKFYMNDVTVTGNALNNVITGDVSNDTLDGGAGADTMNGGLGNDTFYVDQVGDVVTDTGGIDTVYSKVSYTLSSDLENLILNGTSADYGTGNSANNILDGSQNGAANVLTGGAGDDTYILGAGDTVVESANQGTDTVITSATYVLSANLENLTLTGTATINGTGNANNNYLDGSGNSASNVLTGMAGDDTYAIDTNDVVVENANEGTDTVIITTGSYTLGANIENLTFMGLTSGNYNESYNATGNNLNNVITGNYGNNILDGAAGADTMIGGYGSDTYVVDNIGDVVVEVIGPYDFSSADQGIDTVRSSVTYTLGNNIENLVLTGTAAINGTGNVLNNLLDGSQNTAANALAGGLGDDTYIVGAGDTVTESASEGTDIVQSSVSFTLGANIENLTLIGSASINGTGNALANQLTGNGGNNTLDGGAGIDTMTGGTGNDTYVIDTLSDVIIENFNEGTDTVKSGITYTLGANLENLTLTGTAAINGTGNELANSITGNSGNNILDGGLGADTLTGGAGNDTYYVDNAGDTIVEAASAGTDTVQSSVNYALSASVENLTLTGTSALNGTGNTLANTINGNSGNNILDGGAGADVLVGGAGDDTYIVDNTADVVTEAASAGTDTVQSSVTYTLISNIENLILTGTSAINATGNTLGNKLTGNSGNNILQGSTGNDTLNGGDGNDIYVFTQGDGIDVINNLDTSAGRSDTVRFTNVASNQLRSVRTVGSDLVLDYGTTDSVILQNYMVSADYRVNLIQFSDVTLTVDQVLNANATVLTSGDDNQSFGENADFVLAGAGNDTLLGNGGDDKLYGETGFDSLSGGAGNDTLDGGADNDTLDGGIGNDSLAGAANDDYLTGGQGSDTLKGGIGNDSLIGGDDSDTYIFSQGDGIDTIYNYDVSAGHADKVQFLDVASTQLRAIRYSGNDLILDYGVSDSIVLQNHFLSTDFRISQIQFTDTTLTVDQLLTLNAISLTDGDDSTGFTDNGENVLAGLGNDTVFGYGGDDRLYGQAGDDVLYGGTGNDYLNGDTGNDILLGEDDNDLLDGGDGNDSLYGGAGNDQLNAGIGDDSLSGDDGNDVLYGGTGNDYLDGGAGNDILIGGIGSDTINGGDGSDIFVFSKGDGIDALAQHDTTIGRVDTVKFTDVASTELRALRYSGYDLVIEYGTSDSLTLLNYYNPYSVQDYRVDQFQFSDTTLTVAQLLAIYPLHLSSGNDAIGLDDTSNTAYADAGDDYVYGNGGDDKLFGEEGSDYLDGGDGSDSLVGGAGDDSLFGQAGNDTLIGSTGSDYMSGGDGSDTFIVSQGDGIDNIYQYDTTIGHVDTLQFSDVASNGLTSIQKLDNNLVMNYGASDSVTLMNYFIGSDYRITQIQFTDILIPVEQLFALYSLTLTSGNDSVILGDTSDTVHGGDGNDGINGTVGNDQLYGDAGADSLAGGSGSDLLDGGNGDDWIDGGSGTDTMLGGAGNDAYYVDDALDVVEENLNEGTDSVNSSVSYALSENVENLYLSGISDINGTGNSLNNTIFGTNGNNILDGGLGNDSLYGGTGNDTYIVDSTGDFVSESASGGTDTVQSSVTYTLTSYVENLLLTGNAAINGTGNTLNNVLTGNGAANTLNGGTGSDTMAGGLGDDTYVVDVAGDVVTENADEGTDTVQSSITYTLGANLENLLLTGTTAINGTGNALANTLTGNSGNNILDGGLGVDALNGGAGNDTYVVDDIGDVVTEAASAGTDLVQASVTYTLSANVENLTLTGTSAINGTGNTAVNTITGNAADNILDGGAGADSLVGGAGNDTYIVDNTGDAVTEAANAGTDTVQSSVSYTLATNVENLTLTGTAAINGTGNTAANVITGNAGNNSLDGGTGADTLIGGTGNDTYTVDNAGDIVTEYAAEGTDLVQSSITYTLTANVEKLTLTGTGNINGTGNADANTLTGNTGNNILDGGLGADTLIGGTGNDTYLVDNVADVVTETSTVTTEIDLVKASVTYTLGANLENLTLTGTDAINGTGNTLANTITGNTSNNVLNGGTGADTLIGGAGDDTYMVDNTGDVVTEGSSAGNDTVQSSITYTLGSNVENLILTGTTALNGTGNTLANTITGNSGANILDGGTGADTLIGGGGNDTYIVDNVGDVITELTGGGTDLVQSSVSYTLSANVEQLTLTGTGNINGTGSVDANTITGNAGNNILDGGAGNDNLIGGAGNDTYIVDSVSDLITENASEGTDLVQASVTYTLAANLENLTLTGTNAINGTGNTLANTLIGNAANNTLNGGTGADTLKGGLGDDIYVVDDAGDVVTENAAEGTDTVQSSITYTLTTNVENLTLTGTTAINGTGNTLANVLTGNSADNVLSGGTGADTMIGGAGNDTYVVDDIGDVVTEAANAGTDLVQSSVTYTLAANIENLTLTGTAAINAAGNTLANTLIGNTGANILDGGTGADTLTGGAGNDTYVVDNVGDLVTENAAEGTDTVQSSITYILGPNLENLMLTGTANINGTGNALNNTITGNAGNNILDGGTGNDNLIGGAGNDTYVVDSATDLITENAAEGTDLVQASVSYTIAANVENITLTGTAAINATGNTLANQLTGNTADNILDGGTGADTMIGGTGNDTYIVDDIGDVVTEAASSGTDTVKSAITYTLGSNVENLTLTGTTAINGTGNTLDNVLTGNSAINTLTGGAGNDTLDGGAGADSLLGGSGNDTYVIDNIGDVITENASEGTDSVLSSVTYTLGTNLENITLTGTGNINGIGNTLANILTGNTGNNQLTGDAGNDTLIGGLGADTLTGGTGNDTYQFTRGDGIDTVVENDATVGNTDVLKFTSGTSYDQLWFVHTGNNLEISIIGTADKTVIKDWYTATANHVEQITTVDGSHTLLDTQVQNLVNAMASLTPPAAGQTTLPAAYQTQLAPVLAANWA